MRVCRLSTNTLSGVSYKRHRLTPAEHTVINVGISYINFKKHKLVIFRDGKSDMYSVYDCGINNIIATCELLKMKRGSMCL